MKRWAILVLLAAAAVTGGSLYATGKLSVPEGARHWIEVNKQDSQSGHKIQAPRVSVVKVEPGDFTETVLVSGSLVAREQILVAPEVNGQRVIDILVDIGDDVKKGQVLARLVTANLDARLAQNAASKARAIAARAQARSAIVRAQAQKAEADAALKRARMLRKSGNLAHSIYDQRLASARTAAAQLESARDGLRVAEAEIEQTDAQRRELVWNRGRADVKAPAAGVISRRDGQIGSVASNQPMFHITRDGEIELSGELPAQQLAKIRVGQRVTLRTAGGVEASGKVRLISPEVDATTRLGVVRIFLGRSARLRIGEFARGEVETAQSSGSAIPDTAVMYDGEGAYVLVVDAGMVRRRNIKVGLTVPGRIEVVKGLVDGDLIVAKAGTFLRDGGLAPVAQRQSVRLISA